MDFHRVNLGIAHFVTHFTHVPRHFGVSVKNKKKLFRENWFENVASDVKKKIALASTKLLLEKSAKTKKN